MTEAAPAHEVLRMTQVRRGGAVGGARAHLPAALVLGVAPLVDELLNLERRRLLLRAGRCRCRSYGAYEAF